MPFADDPAPDHVFLDVEATGLLDPSYPISVGIARCDGTSAVRLIRPHASWSAIRWDPASVGIHGLTRERVEAEGLPVEEVAAWLNAECGGRITCSDAPPWDAAWLVTLFRAAFPEGGVRPDFALSDCDVCAFRALHRAMPWLGRDALLRRYATIVEDVTRRFPHTHRADEDALARAMVHRECALAS